MVQQAHEASDDISPQAGPSEVENHMLSDIGMSVRSAQQIGRQLAQIGDEMNSRWSEKLRNQWPQHQHWQGYGNVLNFAAMNGRIVGRLQWSRIMPMVRASWVVPQLHSQACQTAIKWMSWVCNLHFPDWSGRTKGFLASALLLVAAAAFTATWKMSES
ncbi:bcl-2-interacting killer [Astyanax mexicanus]|uniref:BCL2 interacting killer n=2 Tax=Astyanax mexicanus TaxID=7994 RepID=A0A8B9JAF4_ASTMX|nr:bcl-2-interacting killer [Astyanax mexicanus]KAG9280326.1 bcl-2-interacting killer [Astyanax mexicanus]